jgi:hypothetical protein
MKGLTLMTIKINVGVNKKIGLSNYGSAGSHCNIEIEADNSILTDASQFMQRVQDAYEMARQSVEEELAHHRPSSGGNNSNRSQEQKQEYRMVGATAHAGTAQKAVSIVKKTTEGIGNAVWNNKGAILVGSAAIGIATQPQAFVEGFGTVTQSSNTGGILPYLLRAILSIIGLRYLRQYVKKWLPFMIVGIGIFTCGVAEAGVIPVFNIPEIAVRPLWDIIGLIMLVLSFFI